MTTLRRRKIIARLREEGIAAYHAGKHIQTCPHKYMDRLQWEAGFLEAKQQSEHTSGTLPEALMIHLLGLIVLFYIIAIAVSALGVLFDN